MKHRRTRGTGSVFPLANGTYMVRMPGGVVNGKPVRIQRIAPDEERAWAILRELAAQVGHQPTALERALAQSRPIQ